MLLVISLVVIVAARHRPAEGGPPWLTSYPTVAAPTGPLRVLVVVALRFFLVAWPVALVVKNDVRRRLRQRCRTSLDDPDVVHALQPHRRVAAVAVLINTVFGVGISLLLVRYGFPGKRVLSALIDLPLAVSPIVVGLALMLVYSGRAGWFGPTLEDAGFQVIFATPGMVMATVLRGPAAGDPRGRAGARGDRRRPGAGRPQPGRQRRADLPADHPALHQVGASSTASC